MAQEIINIGALANDGSGDTIRNAGRKINANFSEFFALPVVASDIRFEQNNIVSKSSNADIVLKPSGTGNVVFPSSLRNAENRLGIEHERAYSMNCDALCRETGGAIFDARQ